MRRVEPQLQNHNNTAVHLKITPYCFHDALEYQENSDIGVVCPFLIVTTFCETTNASCSVPQENGGHTAARGLRSRQDRIWAWINNATAHVKCLSIAQALLAKTTWVGLVGTTPIRLYLQMATDRPLFCTLNNRGKRQYRKTYGKPRELSEKFAEYASIGLPAHKAAIEGNVQALEEIFLWKGTKGVPALDRNCATPLHLAARRSHAPAIK